MNYFLRLIREQIKKYGRLIIHSECRAYLFIHCWYIGGECSASWNDSERRICCFYSARASGNPRVWCKALFVLSKFWSLYKPTDHTTFSIHNWCLYFFFLRQYSLEHINIESTDKSYSLYITLIIPNILQKVGIKSADEGLRKSIGKTIMLCLLMSTMYCLNKWWWWNLIPWSHSWHYN